jgi:hypothetical protein
LLNHPPLIAVSYCENIAINICDGNNIEIFILESAQSYAVKLCKKLRVLNKTIKRKNKCKICTLNYCISGNDYKEILNKTKNNWKSVNEQIALYD